MASFEAILQAVGFERIALLKKGEHWVFYRALAPGGWAEARLLFLDSGASWKTSEEAAIALKSEKKDFQILVQTSSAIAQQLGRLTQTLQSTRAAMTVRGLLLASLQKLLRFDESAKEGDPRFVNPSVKGPAGSEGRALEVLKSWLWENPAAGPLGVLLANAGVGKTTVFRQLHSLLLSGAERSGFPLLIESSQWARIASMPDLELWDIWKQALDALYSVTMQKEFFEMCVETGAIIPLFDGLDELCAKLTGQFLPTATLVSLREFADKGESRILVSARNEFWESFVDVQKRIGIDTFELLPFNNQQTARYLEVFFPKDFTKRERASQILARLDKETSKAGYPTPRMRITNVPAVVAMVAECADLDDEADQAVGRFGQYLDEGNPLMSLLKFVCLREKLRRIPGAEPEKQVEWLTDLSVDFDDHFSREDLRSYAEIELGLGTGENELQKILAHALLESRGNAVRFRFAFVPEYLAAMWLSSSLRGADTDLPTRVVALLARYSSGGTSFVQYAAEHLSAIPTETLKRRFGLIRARLTEIKAGEALSGLLHLAIKTAESLSPTGPKGDRTELTLEILNLPDGFLDLTVTGKIANLDLSGTKLTNCTFRDAGFSNCQFDAKTSFVDCRFEGKLEVEKAEGIGQATFRNCDFRGQARDVLQNLLPTRESVPIGQEQVVEAFRHALDKFRKGPTFKSMRTEDLRKGTLRYSPLRDTVLEALIEFQIIELHMISGVGQNAGVHVVTEQINDVRQFLDNNFLVGRLKLAVDKVIRDFVS
jgi:hypothetical protein